MYKYFQYLFLLILANLFSAIVFAQSDISFKKEQKNRALKILLISDLNDAYGSTTYSAEVKWVISKIDSIKPDLILCGGDMVAGQKASLTAENIKDMWAGFNDAVFKPIVDRKIPYGFTIGNHDASPNYTKDRAEASAYWNANKLNTNLTFIDNTHYPYYYSYLKNNVFFISWDASSADIKPEMLDWMKTQLQSNIAKKARLRALLGHLPLYAIVDAKNKGGEVLAKPQEHLKFFNDNGVDVYFSGHQHAYFPAQKEGVTLFHLGLLGGGARKIIGSDEPATKAFSIVEIPVKKPKNFLFNGYKPVSNATINLSDMPEIVNGFNGTVNRIDVK
jgi:predicted MPP superfamily phosphohydrolase